VRGRVGGRRASGERVHEEIARFRSRNFDALVSGESRPAKGRPRGNQRDTAAGETSSGRGTRIWPSADLVRWGAGEGVGVSGTGGDPVAEAGPAASRGARPGARAPRRRAVEALTRHSRSTALMEGSGRRGRALRAARSAARTDAAKSPAGRASQGVRGRGDATRTATAVSARERAPSGTRVRVPGRLSPHRPPPGRLGDGRPPPAAGERSRCCWRR